MKRWITTCGFGAVVLGTLAFAMVQSQSTLFAANPQVSPQVAPVQSASAMRAEFEQKFIDAAATIKPSVVSIYSSRKVKLSLGGFDRFPFGDFFERDFFDGFPRQAPREREFEQQGMGSGVIIDANEGIILTNHHVIRDADQLRVRLHDGREYPANVIGNDEQTDLAVIHIEADQLTAATLGHSSEARVGQWVMAVGSPLGLSQTVTSGIVSATGRDGVGLAQYEDFIQTDAAINHGNSGGPLIDLNGHVIGINTAIMSRTGGNIGIGMAIPIDMARSVMQQLVEEGSVTRGFLGVVPQDLTFDLAQSFGFEGTRGVLLGEVGEDSPAAKGGMEAGDIILEIDGKSVEDASALRHRVAQIKPGFDVQFKLWRDGKTKTVRVQLGERTGETISPTGELPAEKPVLGMKFADPNYRMLQQLNLPADTQGALVVEVQPGSMASRAGLRTGDVVVQVQGAGVRDARSTVRELRKHDLDEGVRLRVLSEGAHRYVFLKSN